MCAVMIMFSKLHLADIKYRYKIKFQANRDVCLIIYKVVKYRKILKVREVGRRTVPAGTRVPAGRTSRNCQQDRPERRLFNWLLAES